MVAREEASVEVARAAYAQRLASVAYGAWEPSVMEDIEMYDLGRIHNCYNQMKAAGRRSKMSVKACNYVLEGAGHHPNELPKLLGIDGLPLPEIAMCGASNAGKSSLLNALLAHDSSKGPASVNARPGWTRSIQVFKLFEDDYENGLLSIADCPGYGSALTSKSERLLWSRSMRRYLR